MARKGIAATLASVLLLSALLVADITVMTAQDNVASSAQTTQIEVRERLLEESLAGITSIQALADVQALLSSNPAECDSIPQYFSSIHATGSASGVDEGISYHANTSASGAPSSVAYAFPPDQLAVLSPFSGYVPGALNLAAASSVMMVGGGGSVSLDRREALALHISLSPERATSLCDSTLSSLDAALSVAPCNATLSERAFAAALPLLVEETSSLGFFLAAGWAPGSSSCSATYWIRLVELGVAGVTGSFDWAVIGSGTTA